MGSRRRRRRRQLRSAPAIRAGNFPRDHHRRRRSRRRILLPAQPCRHHQFLGRMPSKKVVSVSPSSFPLFPTCESHSYIFCKSKMLETPSINILRIVKKAEAGQMHTRHLPSEEGR
jgi:hypothetical protein